MRILILNWRDIKNPSSGGAEILTFEMAKCWVKWGNHVTWFSSIFPEGKENEVIDGIEFIRGGFPDPRAVFNSVYYKAFKYYKKHFKGKYDIVIDEIHGLPFFTPFYVKEKKIAFICELGGVLWDMFGYINAIAGRGIEKIYTRFIYKNTFFITISPSTREELIKYGISENNVSVIPMGITVPKNITQFPKEKKLTLIFVARLTKAKGIEDAIFALHEIKKKLPRIQLWVVGRGNNEYVNYLHQIVDALDLKKNIIFYGFISEQKKFELLSRAKILLVPSIKEGWGLTVAEAGVAGTPSVTYNALGLKDVLKNNSLGIVTRENTPEALATAALDLLHNEQVYKNYLKKIAIFKEQIGWEKTARAALKQIQNQLK